MRNAPLLFGIIWLSTVCARASMWSDPEREEMLRQSEVISLVEVFEGGKYVAKFKRLAAFKGTAPRSFTSPNSTTCRGRAIRSWRGSARSLSSKPQIER